MKFDVVLGNPPYQEKNKTLQNRLWMQFVDKAFEVVSDSGYVAFVTPSNWATTPTLYDKWFVSKNPIVINIHECGKHFLGIGITFSYYIVQNSPPTNDLVAFTTEKYSFNAQLPAMAIGTDPSPITVSIYNKVLQNTQDKIKSKKSNAHYSYRAGGKISDTETPVFKYKVLSSPGSSKKAESWLWGNHVALDQTGPRVVTALYPGWWKTMIVTTDLQTTDNFVHFYANTIEQAQTLKEVLLSKLYLFLVFSLNSTRGIKAWTIRQLPAVDLSRSWTDEELYNHFGLTPDEIKLIEETVK